MSDSKLARLCGVSPATVGRWTSGDRDPSFENLEIIATAVGISVAVLVADAADSVSLREAQTKQVLEALRLIEDAVTKSKAH